MLDGGGLVIEDFKGVSAGRRGKDVDFDADGEEEDEGDEHAEAEPDEPVDVHLVSEEAEAGEDVDDGQHIDASADPPVPLVIEVGAVLRAPLVVREDSQARLDEHGDEDDETDDGVQRGEMIGVFIGANVHEDDDEANQGQQQSTGIERDVKRKPRRIGLGRQPQISPKGNPEVGAK